MLNVIENEFWQVGVLPQTGASLAFARLKHEGRWLDLMRPTPESSYTSAPNCASYVLIPWSNRIRDGQFMFGDKRYNLRLNSGEGTAIHGVAREFPWTIEAADTHHVTVRFDSGEATDVNFPWRFSTQIAFKLDGQRFSIVTQLTNADRTPMPAGFGHHPYFQRTFASPNDMVQVEIPCAEYFELEKCLPSAGPVPLTRRVDFQNLRPLGDEFIDDCLTKRTPGQPIRFVYRESGKTVTMHANDVFENIVVYIPQGKTFFAVEPVTNANDGFNLYAKGIPGSGVFVLQPGEAKQGAVTLAVV